MGEALRELSEEYPHVHPHLQVIPFQHIYRLLDEGDLDAVVGFKAPDSMKISVQGSEKGSSRLYLPAGSSALRT